MRYKPLDETITRREACLILDRKRFDSLVRAGEIEPVGQASDAKTAPLLFDQQQVRHQANSIASQYRDLARTLRAEARRIRGRQTPFTRRQLNAIFGERHTGILLRSGKLVASGTLTDTQTAAHTFDPAHVTDVMTAVAAEADATARALTTSARARVPA